KIQSYRHRYSLQRAPIASCRRENRKCPECRRFDNNARESRHFFLCAFYGFPQPNQFLSEFPNPYILLREVLRWLFLLFAFLILLGFSAPPGLSLMSNI